MDDFIKNNAKSIIVAIFFAGGLLAQFKYHDVEISDIKQRQEKKIKLANERHHELEHRIRDLEMCK
jgi:hypothetical protein